MPKRFATTLLLSGVVLATASCESSQQKEAKRINVLNVENCLMKKEDSTYCDRVNPKLTSEDVMKQVTEQKGIIKKDLTLKRDLEDCLQKSLISSCKKINISQIDVETQNSIAEKIQEINIKKCVDSQLIHYCNEVNLTSTDKGTEDSVRKSIEVIQAKQNEAVATERAKNFEKIIANISSDKPPVINTSEIVGNWGNKTSTAAAQKPKDNDINEFKKELDSGYPPAKDYMSSLKKRLYNKENNATNILSKMANIGIPEATIILQEYNSKKEKPSLKTKQQALKEICEAGAEYSRDGYGTQAQIARELAFWALDLYKQSGGAASEGQLKNAATHGYMFENCSTY